MEGLSKHILLFFVPMIASNILHMVIIKKGIFSGIAVPIAARLFGRNKTYRGLVVLPLISAVAAGVGSLFLDHGFGLCVSIGAGLGLVYIISELPNSFIKRRLGIGEGQSSENHKLLQLIMDKVDSLLGICLFYYLAGMATAFEIVIIFCCGLLLHLSLSYLLYKIRIKEAI